MVLANWKASLADAKLDWSERLPGEHFWALVNYVVDHVSFPSCTVYAGCHEETPETPICWAAVRAGEVVMSYARQSVSETPELAAALERDLLTKIPVPCVRGLPYNPFREMKRR